MATPRNTSPTFRDPPCGVSRKIVLIKNNFNYSKQLHPPLDPGRGGLLWRAWRGGRRRLFGFQVLVIFIRGFFISPTRPLFPTKYSEKSKLMFSYTVVTSGVPAPPTGSPLRLGTRQETKDPTQLLKKKTKPLKYDFSTGPPHPLLFRAGIRRVGAAWRHRGRVPFG